MGTYASGTQVSSDRSVLEISKTVRRYGADQFAFMEGSGTAAVAFVMHNRQVRFTLTLPDRAAREFTLTPTGKTRTTSAAADAYRASRAPEVAGPRPGRESQTRGRRRRHHHLRPGVLRPALVLPGGQTVYDHVADAVEDAYRGHDGPLLAITQGGTR